MPPEPAVGRTGSVSNGSVIRRACEARSWKRNLVKPGYWHTCGRLRYPLGSSVSRLDGSRYRRRRFAVCQILEFSIVFPRGRAAFSTTRSIAFGHSRTDTKAHINVPHRRDEHLRDPWPRSELRDGGGWRIRTRPVLGVRYPPGPLTPGGCMLFRFPWVHVRSREEQMYSLFHVRRSTLVLGS